MCAADMEGHEKLVGTGHAKTPMKCMNCTEKCWNSFILPVGGATVYRNSSEHHLLMKRALEIRHDRILMKRERIKMNLSKEMKKIEAQLKELCLREGMRLVSFIDLMYKPIISP